MHTGVDLGGPRKTLIKAAAPGTVVKVVGLALQGGGDESAFLWNDSNGNRLFDTGEEEGPVLTGRTGNTHGLGQAIMIQHSNGKYSLYGHLDAIRKDIYQAVVQQGTTFSIAQGDPIGLMGFTEYNTRNSTNIHVHFEIKDNPALGNTSDAGPYWGYTPGHPDLYGYHDPREYIQNVNIEILSPISVQKPPAGVLNARSSPGLVYIPGNDTNVVDQIGEGQKYVTFKRTFFENRYWYFIYLTSSNAPIEGPDGSNNGHNGGWVADIVTQDPAATQVRVLAAVVNVRSGPGTSNTVIGRIYSEERFVTFGIPTSGPGCSQAWYKIYLPGDQNVQFSGPSEGWVCGEFVTPIPSSGDTTLPVVNAFNVTPSSIAVNGSFNISYTVSDTGGSGLKQVELWRANVDGTINDPSWNRIGNIVPLSGNSVTNNFSDSPSIPGNYWYGIHVFDNANNYTDERIAGLGPVGVTVTPPSDTIPDAFSFTSQSGVALNTNVTSNTITVSGINAAASISITGGSYRINGGSFTTALGTVNNGNTVAVRLTSSGSFSMQTCATLNIGGVEGSFCATTQAASPAGSLQFSTSTFSVNENGGSAIITITRTGGSNGAVGATFTTSIGTAQAGSDYTAVINQTVSFANGNTANKTVNIPIINDSTFEGNETVSLTLSNPTGGATLGSPSTAVLTIVEDDTPPPIVTITAITSIATESGLGQGRFSVGRTGGDVASPLIVNYTVSGNATPGVDYQGLSGSVTIPALFGSREMLVTPIDDTIVENNETVTVTLSSNAAYTIGVPASATVTIVSDDPPGPAGSLQFSSASYNVNENGGNAVITITRTGGSNGAVGVTFTASNGTAQSGSDYTAVNQVVSFANGDTVSQTVNVSVTNDGNFESNETVDLTLSNATGGASLGNPSTAVLTIVDESAPAAIVFVEPAGICNGNNPCFTSIQAAINAVAFGGTVEVAQGIYHQNIFVDTSKSLTLAGGWNSSFTTRANDPALTMIDGDINGDGVGDGRVITFWAGSGVTMDITIERFTIQNGKFAEGGGITAYAFASGTINLSLTQNILRNNSSINYGGAINIFSNEAGSNAQATLTNNLINGNTTNGEGAGISAFSLSSSNTTINLLNNSISDNVADIGGGLEASAENSGVTNVSVKNSIIWGNSAIAGGQDIAIQSISGGAATVTASFSIIGDVLFDAPATYNDTGNNIDLNPLFVNASGGDFHLSPGSPALDKGTSEGAPAVDFEGDPRPLGGGYDLGADERSAISNTPDITVTPASHDFGALAVGNTSANKTVTVKNDGTANLSLGAISVGGSNANQFAKAADNCSKKNLGPGASCTVAARFKPTSNGAKTATLIIPSNDPDENPFNVSLSGTGGTGTGIGPPDVTVTPVFLDFGSIAVKKSVDQIVVVKNDGTADLALTAITLGGANANQFDTASDQCSKKTLAPNASCTVKARFKPTSTGAKTAILIIPSNDPDENPVNVSLSGTGKP